MLKLRDKLYILINPSAASGHGMKTWRILQQKLKQKRIRYKAYIPAEKNEMGSLVRELTDLADDAPDCHLLVMGGDGTLNLVLQNIVNLQQTVLSYIPTGSGNDFARGMGISKDVDACLERLLHGEEQLLDYGIVTWKEDRDWKIADSSDKGLPDMQGRFLQGKSENVHAPGMTHYVRRRFLISSGLGYDADICEEVDRSRLKRLLNKVRLGKLTYLMIALKQIVSRKCPAATILLDGEKTIDMPGIFLCVGMILPYEGGGVPFCPKADPKDGLFDVCLVRRVSVPVILSAIIAVYMKKHYSFRAVQGLQCRKLELKLAESQWIHYDGEVPAKVKEVSWQCCQGLRFL